MTVIRLLRLAKELSPSNFSDETILMWISQVENTLASDITEAEPTVLPEITVATNATMLVPHPYDRVYLPYVQAQIAYAQGETDLYSNYITLYNAYRDEWLAWVLNGEYRNSKCYVSAYALAVEHGYVGTIEQWLESLHGEKGEKGDGVVILGHFDTLELLEQEHPEGKPGDYYEVGLTADTALVYYWDNVAEEWHGIDIVDGQRKAREAAANAMAAADMAQTAAGMAQTASVTAAQDAIRAETSAVEAGSSEDAARTAAGQTAADRIGAEDARAVAVQAAETAAAAASEAENAVESRFNFGKWAEPIIQVGVNKGIIYRQNDKYKGAIIKAERGVTYTLTLTGLHNRGFIAGYVGSAFPAGGETAVTVYNSGVTKAKTEPTVMPYANEAYDYLILTAGYDLGGFYAALTVERRETAAGTKVNGIDFLDAAETSELIDQKIGDTEFMDRAETAELIDQKISQLPKIEAEIYTSTEMQIFTRTADLYAAYDQLVAEYPGYVSQSVIGTDAAGTEIREYTFSSGVLINDRGKRKRDAVSRKKEVLLITGVHGYERVSLSATFLFLRDLCAGNAKLSAIRNEFTFRVIPVVCPYGLDNQERANANGVNINRNFQKWWVASGAGTRDWSGPSAASELETQIVQSWVDQHLDAALFVDYHNSGYEEEISYMAGNNDVPGMGELKASYLRAMWRAETYWTREESFGADNLFAYTGDFGHYAMSYKYAEDKGLTAVCLEGSWQVNGTALYGPLSVKTGAETLGNFLAEHLKAERAEVMADDD